jgi:hypothetical protein
MSPVDPATGADQATMRLLANELAKSLWATAKPSASGGDDDGGTASAAAADAYSTLFTDVLADAIAGPAPTNAKTSTGTSR